MRIALGLSYDGTSYHGWQKQRNLLTIQLEVERALSQVANHPVIVICAGRTDTGVHALEQVGHFDSVADRTTVAWVHGSNSYLPPNIRVLWAQAVSEEFHARFSAIGRRYQYILFNGSVVSPLMRNRVAWYPRPLDEHRMQTALTYLLGQHNFNSFRTTQCQSKSPIRTITRAAIKKIGFYLLIDITANAFLHRMVRHIVGMLISIGSGKKEMSWAKTLLEQHHPKPTIYAAPAKGLYLHSVMYPSHFCIYPMPDKLFFLEPF